MGSGGWDRLIVHTTMAVLITAGRAMTVEDGVWRVPKQELLRPLITSLEGGRMLERFLILFTDLQIVELLELCRVRCLKEGFQLLQKLLAYLRWKALVLFQQGLSPSLHPFGNRRKVFRAQPA